MTEKQSEIIRLLKQAYAFLKHKEIEKSIIIYQKIKLLYKQLPQGFFEEKNELTKNVLTFYENLNNMRNKLANTMLRDKSAIIIKQLDIAKSAIKTHNFDEAVMAYSVAREAYSLLPEGFFEPKVELQQKLLEVHQQIIDVKKSYSMSEAQTKLQSIRTTIKEIQNLIKKGEVIIAVQKYGEIKVLYDEMPKGFIKNEYSIQNEILEIYKDITTAKNNLALKAIHNNKKKIERMLKNSLNSSNKKDFDLALEYYKQSVEVYNGLPQGFNKTKVNLRNEIYDTYYNVVSSSDMVTLGELGGYAKDKYFSLLKQIVNAYEIVETGRFEMLPQIYKSVYILYQELPVGLVSKKTMIKEGIRNIYLMYKLYARIESLQEAEDLQNYMGIETIITDITEIISEVEEHVPNSLMLINFAKKKLNQYKIKLKMARIETKQKMLPLNLKLDTIKVPELPAPQQTVDINKVNDFMKKAMDNLVIKNYAKSLTYAKEILKVDPSNQEVKALIQEIKLEKKGKGIKETSKIDLLISSALNKYENYDLQGALADAKAVLQLDPNNQEAYIIVQKIKSAIRR